MQNCASKVVQKDYDRFCSSQYVKELNHSIGNFLNKTKWMHYPHLCSNYEVWVHLTTCTHLGTQEFPGKTWEEAWRSVKKAQQSVVQPPAAPIALAIATNTMPCLDGCAKRSVDMRSECPFTLVSLVKHDQTWSNPINQTPQLKASESDSVLASTCPLQLPKASPQVFRRGSLPFWPFSFQLWPFLKWDL